MLFIFRFLVKLNIFTFNKMRNFGYHLDIFMDHSSKMENEWEVFLAWGRRSLRCGAILGPHIDLLLSSLYLYLLIKVIVIVDSVIHCFPLLAVMGVQGVSDDMVCEVVVTLELPSHLILMGPLDSTLSLRVKYGLPTNIQNNPVVGSRDLMV